jgi:hypothetical protein
VRRLKNEPELRHVLAHLFYAIRALRNGQLRLSLYELESVEGLIFWGESDPRIERWLRREAMKKKNWLRREAMKKKKKGKKNCK